MDGQNEATERQIPGRALLPYLRLRRVIAKMSLRELSRQSGVSTDALVALEKGERRANAFTIGKLAEALKIKPSQLVYDDPEKEGRGAA